MIKKMTTVVRGGHSNTKPGIKPSVARVSEDVAKANIEAKLALLKAAISQTQDEGGSSSLDGCPSSRTKFNEWSPKTTHPKALTRNANATLKRYPDLMQSVDAAVDLVKILRNSSAPRAGPDRNSRIEAARRAQRIHWTLRTIAERAIVGARREVARLRDEVSVVKAAKDSAQREFDRVSEEMRNEMQRLRSDNAALIKQLKAVIPIGKRK